MGSVFLWWAIWALALLIFSARVGTWVNKKGGAGIFGILVDSRGRYSLTQFQIILWTLIILSLIMGVWTAKALGDIADPMDFEIPPELLILMGISATSTVLSTTIKAGKDTTRKDKIKTSDKPEFKQMILKEEGSDPGDVVDVTKFQNFLITVLLAIAFVVSALNKLHGIEADLINAATDAAEVTNTQILLAIKEIPGVAEQSTWLTLLGISHAGYITGKIPNQE